VLCKSSRSMLEMVCAGDIQMRGGLLEVVLVPKQQRVRSDWPTVGMSAKAAKTPLALLHTHTTTSLTSSETTGLSASRSRSAWI
jgi:hypothetical protein